MIVRLFRGLWHQYTSSDTYRADILYILVPGITDTALKGLEWIIQSGADLKRCLLISAPRDFGYNHAILIERSSASNVILQGAFVSGHAGEGAKGPAKALALLEQHDVAVGQEAVVQPAIWNRLCKCSLTEADLTLLWETGGGYQPVPYYISDFPEKIRQHNYWSQRPSLMPFAMIETELQDLARDLWQAKSNDDSALVRGYRRLEENAKIKSTCTATKGPWGSIFGADKGLLTWPDCVPDQAKGRMQLFQAVGGAFRNLGSGLVDHSQKITVAARATAEKNAVGQRS